MSTNQNIRSGKNSFWQTKVCWDGNPVRQQVEFGCLFFFWRHFNHSNQLEATLFFLFYSFLKFPPTEHSIVPKKTIPGQQQKRLIRKFTRNTDMSGKWPTISILSQNFKSVLSQILDDAEYFERNRRVLSVPFMLRNFQ